MLEVWASVPDTNNVYQVSNMGRVKSVDRYAPNRWGPIFRKGKMLSPATDKNGYLMVLLYDNEKKPRAKKVHRLVAYAFVDRGVGCHVNHIDGNKANNLASNLEWVTRQENMQHALRSGLIHTTKRIDSWRKLRKLSDDDILRIREKAEAGVSQTVLAKMFNVRQPTISYVVNRKLRFR